MLARWRGLSQDLGMCTQLRLRQTGSSTQGGTSGCPRAPLQGRVNRPEAYSHSFSWQQLAPPWVTGGMMSMVPEATEQGVALLQGHQKGFMEGGTEMKRGLNPLGWLESCFWVNWSASGQ